MTPTLLCSELLWQGDSNGNHPWQEFSWNGHLTNMA
jgi:hypothetical protein